MRRKSTYYITKHWERLHGGFNIQPGSYIHGDFVVGETPGGIVVGFLKDQHGTQLTREQARSLCMFILGLTNKWHDELRDEENEKEKAA
jgi:hypothetical protein